MRRPAPTHEDRAALAERIREVVRLFGPRRVAEAAGVSLETVRRVTNLGHTPTVRLISGVCANLGVSGDWLLLGQGPRLALQVPKEALQKATTGELLAAVAGQCGARGEELDVLEHAAETLADSPTSRGELEALRVNLGRISRTMGALAGLIPRLRPEPAPPAEVLLPSRLPRLVATITPEETRQAQG